ncbi:MAG: lysozyme [Solirubrobacteraceae bacterium]
MTVRSRWASRLRARQALLERARRQVAYWSTRAGSARGAEMLRARVALRAARERQVAEARRVLDRHPGAPTGLSAEGLAFIASSEGFRARPYFPTPGDRLTIGYGETAGVRPGMVWTRAHALERLKIRADQDYGRPVLAAAARASVDLTQRELDALTSLVYNLGPGILDRGRSMGDALAAGSRRRMADAFLLYDVGPGQKRMLGLTLRRKAERRMFLKRGHVGA